MGGVVYLFEGVVFFRFLYCLQDIFVDFEVEGDSQDGQGEIGQYVQDREIGE